MKVSDRFLNLCLLTGMVLSGREATAAVKPAPMPHYAGFTAAERSQSVMNAIYGAPSRPDTWLPKEDKGKPSPMLHSAREWLDDSSVAKSIQGWLNKTGNEYEIGRHSERVAPWVNRQIEEVQTAMRPQFGHINIPSHFNPMPATSGSPLSAEMLYNPLTHAMTSCGIEVKSFPKFLETMTVKDFKVALAHEIAHCHQPYEMPPLEKERLADLGAAKTYGPQAVIDFLEKAKGEADKNDVHHLSISARQEAIRKAFPEMARPAAAASHKGNRAVVVTPTSR